MKRIIASCISIITLMTLTGCATTAKHTCVPKDHPHAVLKGDWVGFKAFGGSKTHTSIIEVDGKQATSFWSWSEEPKIRITPGTHKIRISVGTGNRWYYDELEMHFHANRFYQVQAHRKERIWTIKVVDVDAESVVFEKDLEPKGGGSTTYIPIYI